ncbi:hypothetical protein GWI33_016184 [Rhynchophorus ferrugineus]|uniref:Uncharacterized protein n=1 Tax=Rhynchophorus ferrugineus TaxID=354439 RepID=A0A834IBN1_RHYFE|nr:hypothetical protein GWI33_016184 [Rhynchophorus ferrugineus]
MPGKGETMGEQQSVKSIAAKLELNDALIVCQSRSPDDPERQGDVARSVIVSLRYLGGRPLPAFFVVDFIF